MLNNEIDNSLINSMNDNFLLDNNNFDEKIKLIEKEILLNFTNISDIERINKYEFTLHIKDLDNALNKVEDKLKMTAKCAFNLSNDKNFPNLQLQICFSKDDLNHIFLVKINDSIIIDFDFLDMKSIDLLDCFKLELVNEIIRTNKAKSNKNKLIKNSFECGLTSITLGDYWIKFPFEKMNFFHGENDKSISRIINSLNKKEEITQFDIFTAHKFYVICSIAYKSINIPMLEGETCKGFYYRITGNFATNIDCEFDHDPISFDLWYDKHCDNNEVQFNLLPRVNNCSIQLNIKKISSRYFLSLASKGFYNQFQILSMYLALFEEGIEVALPFKKMYLDRIYEKSILEIDEKMNLYECIYDNNNNYIEKQMIGKIEKEDLNEILYRRKPSYE